MVARDTLVARVNEVLGLNEFRDFGPMGLQISGIDAISHVAAGVSVNQDLIDEAIRIDADMLIVHHGLFWNNEPRYVDERLSGRINSLLFHKISLLAYHLCLDAHPRLGNNVSALDPFQGELRKFGDIGWGKKLNRPFRRVALEDWSGIKYLYGPTQIRKVASVVGGGAHYIHDAVREGYDLFITGEAAEPSEALAKELGINFVAQGHYNTEKSGVQNLLALIEDEFQVATTFIDIPNEV